MAKIRLTLLMDSPLWTILGICYAIFNMTNCTVCSLVLFCVSHTPLCDPLLLCDCLLHWIIKLLGSLGSQVPMLSIVNNIYHMGTRSEFGIPGNISNLCVIFTSNSQKPQYHLADPPLTVKYQVCVEQITIQSLINCNGLIHLALNSLGQANSVIH